MNCLISLAVSCWLCVLVNCRPVIEKKVNLYKDASFAISMGNMEESPGANDLFEFDMKISKHRKKRAVTQVVNWKWTNGVVPYVFDTYLPISEAKKTLVLKAFRHIEEFTCVRFVPRTNETDFVNITTLQGCWSYVGRSGGMQQYSLGNNCEDFGVIVHESLHALGFYHEHNRPDRDNHIIVNYTNVRSGAESAFTKFTLESGSISLQNISYDIQSIMHYQRYTFTKHTDQNGYVIPGQSSMTMYAIGNPEQKLGSSIGLSYKDKLRINKYYECNIIITTTSITTTGGSGVTTTSGSGVTTTGGSGVTTTGGSDVTTTMITTTNENNVSTTNGSSWGKPDHAAQQHSSFVTILLISFMTLVFINLL